MTTAAHWAYLETHPKVTIASNGSFVPNSAKEDE